MKHYRGIMNIFQHPFWRNQLPIPLIPIPLGKEGMPPISQRSSEAIIFGAARISWTRSLYSLNGRSFSKAVRPDREN